MTKIADLPDSEELVSKVLREHRYDSESLDSAERDEMNDYI